MSQSQKMMLASTSLETAQEVMDLGDMAYPLDNVTDPDQDLDVRETKASELWDIVAGTQGPKMSRAQEDKFHGYTWERVALNRQDDDEDIQRLNGLVHLTMGHRQSEHRFEVLGHLLQDSFIVCLGQLIASKLTIGIGTEIEGREISRILEQHTSVLLNCIIPLTEFDINCSLFETQVNGLRMLDDSLGKYCQRVAPLLRGLGIKCLLA
jgi:hypothetical protein